MKKLHPKSTLDELCYPFIYEDSLLCDYEILTDDLARMVGWAINDLKNLIKDFPESNDLKNLEIELNWLLEICYHLNGSIRGKLAIFDEDYKQLLDYYKATKDKTKSAINGFVLPGGVSPVGILNKCSSMSKQTIRLMILINNKEQKEVPEILPKFANVLCNYFFTSTILINQVTGFKETPFVSKSYK